MANKLVKVKDHNRSKPNPDKPWSGPGKKPGPKTVHVEEHDRSKPSK